MLLYLVASKQRGLQRYAHYEARGETIWQTPLDLAAISAMLNKHVIVRATQLRAMLQHWRLQYMYNVGRYSLYDTFHVLLFFSSFVVALTVLLDRLKRCRIWCSSSTFRVLTRLNAD